MTRMELPLTRMSSCKHRSVIRFFTAYGETAAAMHTNLVRVYGAQCMSEGVVRQWVRDFRVGRDEGHDLPREGRPKDSLMSDVIAGVCSHFKEDRRLMIRQIEYTMHKEMCNPISRVTVHHIVHDELAMKKVSSQWVPKQLTRCTKISVWHRRLIF